MEERLLYKQEIEGSIPSFPNDIVVMIFWKIYFIAIYYGYEGASKLTSTLVMLNG